MKFTLSWLKDHLETTASVDEIAEALTDLGLEVEEISNPAARLSEFSIGKVKMTGREAIEVGLEWVSPPTTHPAYSSVRLLL